MIARRVGAAAILALAASGAQAATLRVPGEFAAIQLAIDAASAGDTVLVAPGTYTNCDRERCTAKVAELFEGLTLLSEGGRDVTTLQLVGGGPPSVLAAVVWGEGIGPGGARVEGFEFRSSIAESYGLAFVGSRDISVAGCRAVDVATSFPSGGGLFQNGGSLEVVGCEFIRCTAAQEGGGIEAIGTFTSSTVVRDCLFEECGPTAMLASGGGDVEVTGCVFRNNFGGPGQAGGLALAQNESAYVSDCWFEENTSTTGPGGLLMGGAVNGAVLTVERCTFVRNEAGSQGGGAQLAANSLLRLSTFVGNRAPMGAAVFASNSVLSHEVRTSVFALNVGGPAVDASLPASAAEGDCNVFWENADGDYATYLPGPSDQFVDPEFCNIPADDYTVRDTSPCAEKNSPVCGQIGAYGIGCGTVSVEPTSWSRVKSWYREEE